MNGSELKQVGFECDDLYLSTGLDREHHLLYKGTLSCKAILYNPSNSEISENVKLITPVELTPSTIEEYLVGEWQYPMSVTFASHSYTTITFQKDTSGINVHDLETDLYGVHFTVTMHYEINGKSFTGVGEGVITQNTVQATISSTIFIGGTITFAVSIFVNPLPATLQAISFIAGVVGLYQTWG
ncbi:hypothetical protein [Thermococcus sp. 2319x1]|uniref:hypothetical protein n=1 Tax=Thermococcus sp. 2319x1 TaxID=1674923 RepID=UPI0015828EC1|nr:hypothetical protein [Thermococcus sp. 2319x1]